MSGIRPRIIPCLLLRGNGLYKTVRFKNPVYVGDPINTVRIFNEKEVDEVVLLDFEASRNGRAPDFEKIGEIASEAFMPMSYGGGVTTVEQAKRILALGVEKIILNSAAVETPGLVSELATAVGSQSVVVAVDARKNLFGRYQTTWKNTEKSKATHPVQWAQEVCALGAGEILLNLVDRDGTSQGYDLELIREMAAAVSVPVVACGGAASNKDLAEALKAGASGAAAGSMFVFHGKHRAVLISYPAPAEIDSLRL
jgi:cyclase